MCVGKELCWVSVQGCAQDCYIKEVNLPSAVKGITDLPRSRGQKLKYFKVIFLVKLMQNREDFRTKEKEPGPHKTGDERN